MESNLWFAIWLVSSGEVRLLRSIVWSWKMMRPAASCPTMQFKGCCTVTLENSFFLCMLMKPEKDLFSAVTISRCNSIYFRLYFPAFPARRIGKSVSVREANVNLGQGSDGGRRVVFCSGLLSSVLAAGQGSS